MASGEWTCRPSALQEEELRLALTARSQALSRVLADGRAPESVVLRKGATDALLARVGQLRLVRDGDS